MHSEIRGNWDLRPVIDALGGRTTGRTLRFFASAQVERPVGTNRFVSHTTLGGLWASGFDPEEELFYMGGTTTAPGYDYHALVGRDAVSQRLEWQMPVPFPTFPLGRFGHVPGTATIAPFVHAAFVKRPSCGALTPAPIFDGGMSVVLGPFARSCGAIQTADGAYPTLGIGFLTPFNLVRADVARGVGRGGRWTFSVDVSREFWSIF